MIRRRTQVACLTFGMTVLATTMSSAQVFDFRLDDGRRGNGYNDRMRDRGPNYVDREVRRVRRDVIEGGSTYGGFYSEGDRFYYVPRGDGRARRGPEVVQFGAYSHIDELAMYLEDLLNNLCLDMHYNYSHNREFRAVYREAYQMLEMAKSIHEAEHRNDRRRIQQLVQSLDPLLHHVQDDVRTWHSQYYRQVGHPGGLDRKLAAIESTVHHLMNDVGIRVGGGRPAGGPPFAPIPR